MRKMVLVSLDAMYKADMLKLKKCMPEEEWLTGSAVSLEVKTVFPALTYPAHTTLVTGCEPARHGIWHNQPFQPEKQPEMRAWYWEERQVKRETLFQAVKR